MRNLPATLLRRSALPAVLAFLTLGLSASPASGDVTCTRVAAPGGSDSADGTVDAPFATVQHLVDSLGPGDTGCIRAGTYHEQNITIRNGGAGDDARVTIASYPGERATIDGRVYVADGANYVTVRDLNLNGHDGPSCGDGCVLPSPTVNGDHIVFQNNDVTDDHIGICFNLGNASYGRAEHDVIQDNRIHDCGTLPAKNHDHGIYVTAADDTQILNNVIYDNADRGVQLYPDAQRTTIRGNVIDGNGEGVIFSGGDTFASNDNVVEHNIITNAKLRYNVESWYPGSAVGSGNVVRDNCIYGGNEGNVLPSQEGFHATNNVVADPHYADRAAGDFKVQNDTCAKVLAGGSPPASPSGSGQVGAVHEATSHAHSRQSKKVLLAHAIARHGHRWWLHLRGRFATRGLHLAYIEVHRGGGWQRISIRHLGRYFRISVDLRVPANQRTVRPLVRVVAPGVGRSRSMVARATR